MKTKRYQILLLLLACLMASKTTAQEPAFRFLASGDIPYSAEEEARYRRLLKSSESENFAFLMHVGDIGSTPCDDLALKKIRDLFHEYPKPVVYTPGDNEWTDCHTVGPDPLERLDKLRKMFFYDQNTLKLSQLRVVHQSRQSKFTQYVENYRFTKAGVLFVMVHVVGSGNNRRNDEPRSMKEYTQRNSANLAFLKESFQEAMAKDVAGIAVVFHANPDFETERTEGFRDVLSTLRDFLSNYKKPVICIHGDSHYYRVDKPFRDSAGKTFMHFTRMEVFGSPNVAGVVITVDPSDPQVFSNRPYYLDHK